MSIRKCKLSKLVIAVLCMAAAVFASFAMVACGTDNGSSEDKKYEAGYKIVLDEPLEFGAEIDYAA